MIKLVSYVVENPMVYKTNASGNQYIFIRTKERVRVQELFRGPGINCSISNPNSYIQSEIYIGSGFLVENELFDLAIKNSIYYESFIMDQQFLLFS